MREHSASGVRQNSRKNAGPLWWIGMLLLAGQKREAKCNNSVGLLNDVALTAHLIINTNKTLISPNIGAPIK